MLHRTRAAATLVLSALVALAGATGASVVARWILSYTGKDDASGLTLLVLHRSSAGWQIVHDASF